MLREIGKKPNFALVLPRQEEERGFTGDNWKKAYLFSGFTEVTHINKATGVSGFLHYGRGAT